MRPAILRNFEQLVSRVPSHIKIVAVSKHHPAEAVRLLYEHGHRCFGENKVQEWKDKAALLPDDIEWHLIGHLQSNKVKYLFPAVRYVHAIDSPRLLEEVDKQAAKTGVKPYILLQVHVARETSKFGFLPQELEAWMETLDFKQFPHVIFSGIMGMASFSDDRQLIRNEFRLLRNIFETAQAGCFAQEPAFKEVSMGMSGDYMIAMEEGSTIIRVGSTIFSGS